ncbi:hypothetical protein B566_EDAN009264 [Ephemera danica]|nr:hypothetical protein B566_EDAN009264 [Ephemera danica]
MAPRVSRKSSVKKTKTPSLKKNQVTTVWDDQEENDVLASPLEESLIKTGKQGRLIFCMKRKPIIGSPKKCIDAVETICDENVETAISSPEKNKCLRTPKRKLFNDDTDCSPSKQTCSPAKIGTNKTPSSLLKKLEITDDDPIEKCGSLKPKSLFGTQDTSYSVARQALHSSQPSFLPGREKQLEALRDFLLARLENKEGARGSLYISGAPGTGKTASVNLTLEHNKQIKSGFKTVYINCTSMNTSKAIFSRVAQDLQVKVQGRTEKANVASIQKHIIHSKKKMLLLLDEVDQLESRNQSVLYTIFEWPCLAGSQLTLIGIANSLDLTDRLLPRLQAHVSCRPQLMHYAPYTKQQITDIINSRLHQAGASHVFKNVAVEMLAAKVAAVSGDARRALDIGRRGIELAETKNCQTVPGLRLTADPGSNTGSPRRSPRKTPQKLCHSETATVGIIEVRNVLDGVYGTSQSLINSDAPGNDGLPMQQKILICSLLLMLRKGKNKDITVGKLHEVYNRVCKKRNFSSVPQSEFYNMCCLVETRGILRVSVSKKDTRLSKLSLQWDDEDISAALCDKNLLADILSDVSCLSGKFI